MVGSSREGINPVSKALTRSRDTLGDFENYGERLYVEGLLEIDRRKKQVRRPSYKGVVILKPSAYEDLSYSVE